MPTDHLEGRMASGQRPLRRYRRLLLFDRAGRQTRRHAPLQRQEQQQGRQCHQRRAGHHVAPFDDILAKVCADPAAFAGDVSTAEWVVKNTLAAAAL